MKAVVVKPPGAGVWIKEVQDPGDPQGRVRIRTLETGICGTDREIVNGRRLTTPSPWKGGADLGARGYWSGGGRGWDFQGGGSGDACEQEALREVPQLQGWKVIAHAL